MSEVRGQRTDERSVVRPLTGQRVGKLLANCESRLLAAGIETPRLDARLLVAAALGCEPDALRLARDRAVPPDARATAEALLCRRIADREPVARILGRREFWSLDFLLSPDTLDPRADSETLVETALALFPEKDPALRVLDLGTGTGCLLLALLHERPHATGVGVDRSADAARMAAVNAARLGLSRRARFIAADWGQALGGRFDLILCNPPYVGEAERAALAPEVLDHDPPAALFAGVDGLDAYRTVFPQLPSLLGEGGAAIVEIGAAQAEAVRALAAASSLAVVATKRDLGGRDRCVVLRSV